MSIHGEENGKITILRMGEQDFPDLIVEVDELIAIGRKLLIVDLTRVAYVNSMGLGILSSAIMRAASAQGDLVLIGVNPRVQKAFELMELEEHIRWYESEDQAIEALI